MYHTQFMFDECSCVVPSKLLRAAMKELSCSKVFKKTIGLQQKRQAIRRRHWRCLCPRYIADAFIELDTYCRNAFYQDVAIHKYVRCALDGIAINRNKSCPDGHQTQIAKRFPCRGWYWAQAMSRLSGVQWQSWYIQIAEIRRLREDKKADLSR